MLARANKAYEASAPPPARSELAKELFPSSSPQAAKQDGNILEQFKRSSQASRAAYGSARNPGSSNSVLKPTAANTSSVTQYVRKQGPAAGFHSSGRSLASLYNHSESFSVEPPAIVGVKPLGKTKSQTQAPVYFEEDDFSDGENLDVDYELPMVKPTPVMATVEAKAKPIVSANLLQQPPPPPPATQYVPWSSSPASHLASKLSRTSSSESMKRRVTDDYVSPELPPAKKRTLPWPKKTAEAAYVTPAKSKATMPWNTTASAVKEQKKQLKGQQRFREDMEEEVRKISETNKAKSTAFLLSKEQRHIQELVIEKNQSVFFTGPAGTGKSVLMRSIIAELKKKWVRDPERLAVTASTGLAACNIGGMTLHSFAGIGLGKETVPELVKKIRRNPKAKNRWMRTKALVIDEISMIDGDLFDKLSSIGRTIRNNGRPWGGIQLIITGDFFQLPPVPEGGEQKREVKFAFDADMWNISIDHTIGLTQVFRQKDSGFADMLNEMRLGRITDETVRAFKALSRPLKFDDGLDMTELFPTRTEVDRSNEARLRNLPGQPRRYEAQDRGDPKFRDKLLQNMMAPKFLELRTGAQVMLIKNIDETLVNGSLGRVIGFKTQATFDLGGYGSDDDSAGVDAQLKKKMKAFSHQLDESSGAQEFPVVQFMAGDGNSRTILAVPEDWKVELPNGEVQAARSQLPLILAWALSIHKAQGQTLERVKVDLGKVFEKGQAYVALSRATNQEGLQVLRFEKHKVMAHPKVVQFYNGLKSAEQALGPGARQSKLANFVKKTDAVPAAPEAAKTKQQAAAVSRQASLQASRQASRQESQSSRTESYGSVRDAVDFINLDDDEEAMASYGY